MCGVAEERQVRDAVARAAQGGLDGVVNSAGIDLIRRFEGMTAQERARVMPSTSPAPCGVPCRAAGPSLLNSVMRRRARPSLR